MRHAHPPRGFPVVRERDHQHEDAIMVLMNMMFVRHLVGVYRSFGGDLLAAIVLGEVAHHNLAPLVNRARTPQDLSRLLRTHADALPGTFLPTNAFSIAQATGMPRETVRRKIASLIRRGWMEKGAGGNLFVTGGPVVAFAAFNHERLTDLLETARAIGALLDEPKPGAAQPPVSGSARRTRRTTGSS